jgi:hypothetical protein
MYTPEYIRGTEWTILIEPEAVVSSVGIDQFVFSAGVGKSPDGRPLMTVREGAGIVREAGGLVLTFTAEQTNRITQSGNYDVILKATPLGAGLVLENALPIEVKFSRLP